MWKPMKHVQMFHVYIPTYSYLFKCSMSGVHLQMFHVIFKWFLHACKTCFLSRINWTLGWTWCFSLGGSSHSLFGALSLGPILERPSPQLTHGTTEPFHNKPNSPEPLGPCSGTSQLSPAKKKSGTCYWWLHAGYPSFLDTSWQITLCWWKVLRSLQLQFHQTTLCSANLCKKRQKTEQITRHVLQKAKSLSHMMVRPWSLWPTSQQWLLVWSKLMDRNWSWWNQMESCKREQGSVRFTLITIRRYQKLMFRCCFLASVFFFFASQADSQALPKRAAVVTPTGGGFVLFRCLDPRTPGPRVAAWNVKREG